jgi:hypothetical protein
MELLVISLTHTSRAHACLESMYKFWNAMVDVFVKVYLCPNMADTARLLSINKAG